MNAKQDAIDARLGVLLPQVIALQESYFSNFGRYFQGLATHASLPDGETPIRADVTVKPGDQPHDYADFWRRVHRVDSEYANGEPTEEHEFPVEILTEVQDITTRIRFDVSQGMEGWTWTLTLEYQDESGHHAKVINREGTIQDWHIVESESLPA